MSKNITLKDVAAYAGVSVTTVSNVVRKWPYVSSEMREHVQRAIDELGYSPHVIAQGLRTGQTQAIAFIVPDLPNPYFAEMVAAAEESAQRFGYTLLIFNSREDPVRESTCIHRASGRWADGLLIAQSAQSQWPDTLWQDVDIPVVAVDRIPSEADIPVCAADNVAAGRNATEYLIALGHRHIAHIAGPQAVRPALDRYTGYLSVLDAHGLSYRRVVQSSSNWEPDDGYHCMLELLSSEDSPTAVLASNDRIAIGALHAIHDRGLRVPYDISVIGVDGIEVSAHLNPPLTTMRQPLHQMAGAAVDMLLRLIRGEQLEQLTMLLEPELIVRQSTSPYVQKESIP